MKILCNGIKNEGLIMMKLSDHGKTALIWHDEEISYSKLLENIRAFEGLYRVLPGDRVAIFAENCPEWIYSFFSAWGHHAIAVPLDAGLPADDISFIIDDCRPSVVFCSSQTVPVLEKALFRIGDYHPDIIVLDSVNMAQTKGMKGRVSQEADNDEVAAILYTSGTTGNPKGVMLTYNNLLACINGISKLNMIKPEDRFLALLPFHHIFPLQGTVIAPLYIGSTSIIIKTLASDEIIAAMQKHKPTMFLGVPRLYEMFHRALMLKVNSSISGRLLFHLSRTVGNSAFSKILFARVQSAFGGSVHTYLTGGAKLDRTVDRDLRALGFKLVEGYGLTETSPLVAFNPFNAVRPGSVGLVMEGVTARIVDGEVVVKGPNIMKGYYNRPDENSRRLRDGWFYTGDKGEFDTDGYLYITGRCDEMIVLPSGKNINPEEIEERILGLSPIISEIGIMQQEGRLVALVLPDFDILNRENILNFIENIRDLIVERYNSTAASFKRISQVIFISEPLPRTRLGKLKRFLMESVSEKKAPPSSYQNPSFDEYNIIRSFIEALTGRSIMPSDHIFLDIGLDSLDRLQLSVYIEKTFGIQTTAINYMKFPTVLSLAEFVRDNKTRMEQSSIEWEQIISRESREKITPGNTLVQLRTFIGPVLSLYHRLQVEGLENIPEQPCIFAANHQSYMDVPMIIQALPRRLLSKTFFLAKEKPVYHNSIVKLLTRGTNTIMIDTNGDLQKSLIKLTAVLRSGCSVVIFPEGTRTRTGALGEFKKTFSIISKALSVPVVPVAIDGTYRLMRYGSIFPKQGKIKLTFLSPVYSEQIDFSEIAKNVRQSIFQVL
jgi:long-chain acyl-CoA synthetase